MMTQKQNRGVEAKFVDKLDDVKNEMTGAIRAAEFLNGTLFWKESVHFMSTLLFRANSQLPRQTPSGRKVRGRKKKKKKKKKNNAKFSGHYVCPRTHNVRAGIFVV